MDIAIKEWHYSHQGTDWEHCSKVKMGKFQSPIDLPIEELVAESTKDDTNIETEIDFLYHYAPEAYCIDHQSHRSIKVSAVNNPSSTDEVIPMGKIVVDGKVFVVDNFHFHAPAEHLFDGCREALELHIVHKFSGYSDEQQMKSLSSIPDAEDDDRVLVREQSSLETNSSGVTRISHDHSVSHEGELVVVSVLFSPCSDESNEFLEKLLSIDGFPIDADVQTVTTIQRSENQEPQRPAIDLSSLIFTPTTTTSDTTSTTTFARYFGSLTTPPLDEVVHWFVRVDPIPASADQLETLSASMRYPGSEGNYRCCNGRRGHPRLPSTESVSSSSGTDPAFLAPPTFVNENTGQQYVWLVNGQQLGIDSHRE